MELINGFLKVVFCEIESASGDLLFYIISISIEAPIAGRSGTRGFIYVNN
jgi:hypothetical protein